MDAKAQALILAQQRRIAELEARDAVIQQWIAPKVLIRLSYGEAVPEEYYTTEEEWERLRSVLTYWKCGWRGDMVQETLSRITFMEYEKWDFHSVNFAQCCDVKANEARTYADARAILVALVYLYGFYSNPLDLPEGADKMLERNFACIAVLTPIESAPRPNRHCDPIPNRVAYFRLFYGLSDSDSD